MDDKIILQMHNIITYFNVSVFEMYESSQYWSIYPQYIQWIAPFVATKENARDSIAAKNLKKGSNTRFIGMPWTKIEREGMAMLKKVRAVKKSLFFGTAEFMLLTVIAFCFVGCGRVRNETDRKLTEGQIAGLRQEYPVCGDMGLIDASMKIPTVSEVKEIYDTFIYGTVKGEMSTYSKNISTGSPELDA